MAMRSIHKSSITFSYRLFFRSPVGWFVSNSLSALDQYIRQSIIYLEFYMKHYENDSLPNSSHSGAI